MANTSMNTRRPSITLCMIARDEDSVIGQALASVQSIVTEMIVVDTGSTDQTREVAQSFGANVMRTPWEGDFAAARNIGLAQATGDWILVLDADEAIDQSQLTLLQECANDSSRCYELVQRHYSNDHRLSDYRLARGEFPTWERNYRGFFESRLVRLFPNNRGIAYVGRIHELVEPSIQRIAELSIQSTEIRLQHYGHTPEQLEKKNKNRLYRSLGIAKASESPSDWKAFYELGVECNRPGQREESVEAFRHSLELNAGYLPSWINLGYVLCELGRATEAVDCLSSALKLDPKSQEAHCNLGVAFLRLQKFKNAEAHLREAVRINPGYLNAFLNLSRALAHQGRLPEAILIAERATEMSKQSPSALADLGTLYVMGGETGIGQALLVAAIQADPSLDDARAVLMSLRKTPESAPNAPGQK